MPKLFSFGLVLLLFFQLPQSGPKSKHSARLGDMQITLAEARIASDQDIQDYGLRPRAGYKVVLVFLRMKNVAQYPSCSYLDKWLRVKQGYQYPISSGFKLKLKSPQTSSVLPTEESSGGFAFEIKDGTEPVTLKLVRNVMGEDFCAMTQHRDTHITGPESLSLSLLGLPANTQQSDALRGQPSAQEAQPPAASQPKLEVAERQSNVILMNDGFEYKVIDYGVGRIQVRKQGTKNDFTDQVFWVKFQVANKAENLIENPRYFPSVLDALRVTDNWGNVYSLRYPQFTDVGGNWFGAEIPIPGGSERREHYRPNESSWAVS